MPFHKSINFGLYQNFKLRANYIDPAILALAMIALTPVTEVFWICLGIFFSIGIWLIVGRHGSTRVLESDIIWPVLAIAAYSFFRTAIDILAINDIAKACEPFSLFFLILCPLMVGMVLIKNPLKWLIIGCRIAVVCIAIYALYMLVGTAYRRIGFGTNSVISSYWILMFACIARFPLTTKSKPWHGALFFYLAIFPVIMAGSRITLTVFGLIFLYDSFCVFRNSRDIGGIAIRLAGLVLVCSLLFILSSYQEHYLAQRFYAFVIAVTEHQSVQSILGLRSLFWEYGLNQFLSHPFFGAGQCSTELDIPSRIVYSTGDIRYFSHLHNMYIDSLAANGVVGFALLVWMHYAIFANLISGEWLSRQEKVATLILLLGILLYGLTGSYLTDGRMTALTIFIFAVLLTEVQRRKLRSRYHIAH